MELEWDERAVEHVERHGLRRAEVEQVVSNSRSRWLRSGRERYIVLGQTDSGLFVKVVLDPLEHGRYYPVTAYDMSEAEKQAYRRRAKR